MEQFDAISNWIVCNGKTVHSYNSRVLVLFQQSMARRNTTELICSDCGHLHLGLLSGRLSLENHRLERIIKRNNVAASEKCFYFSETFLSAGRDPAEFFFEFRRAFQSVMAPGSALMVDNYKKRAKANEIKTEINSWEKTSPR